MATKQKTDTVIDSAEDMFEGLVEEQSSQMTVWSQDLDRMLSKEPAVKFANGKRSQALEAVYKFIEKQQFNPIVRYVVIMGLRTLNRKVGK